jgi:uncharacterized membrane protein
MEKNRLEAFSDGVLAVILTIMVLDLEGPKEPTLDAMAGSWSVYVDYAMSYGNVFMVWLNHHRFFSSLERVDYPLLLANGRLHFFVSLVRFATTFASESHWTAPVPLVLYGVVMIALSLAFVRLRVAASKCAEDERVAADRLAEVRISLLPATTSLIGSLCAFVPRSALLRYAVTPVRAPSAWEANADARLQAPMSKLALPAPSPIADRSQT